MNRLILASCSPRRVELLRRLGLPFETDATDIDEECCLSVPDAVELLSLRKAEASFARHPGCYIIGADTLVSVDGKALGKPSDPPEAVRMLHQLSGRIHQVYTGVTVISPDGSRLTEHCRTDVSFVPVPDEEIQSYVLSGEPMDKAGGYALQGRAGCWVDSVHGSDSSVIGLPLHLVRSLLLKVGFPLAEAQDQKHLAKG